MKNRLVMAGVMILSCMSLAGAVEKPWELSLGGGWTVAQTETAGYTHSQSVMWGSMGYHLAPAWSIGMEGGHFFKGDTDISAFFSPFVVTEHNSATYIGPYVQGEIPFQRLSFFGRIGLGAATSSSHITFDSSPMKSYADGHETDMATTLAIGARFWLASNLGLGIGMRDVLLFQYESEFNDQTFSSDDTLHGRNLLMPFGELIFKF